MRKNGIHTMGLSLIAAFSLMALAAASAQGETGANWMVNGAAINATLLPAVGLQEVEALPGTKEHHLSLTFIFGKSSGEILCSEMQIEASQLKSAGSSLGKGRFAGCVVLLGGKTSAPCEPYTETEKKHENGVLLTKLLKGLIVLHTVGGNTQTLERIEPEEGNVLLNIQTGEECAIGEKAELTGKFFAQDNNGEFRQEVKTHLFNKGPLTAMTLYGNEAVFHGSVIVGLTGEHIELNWSASPA